MKATKILFRSIKTIKKNAVNSLVLNENKTVERSYRKNQKLKPALNLTTFILNGIYQENVCLGCYKKSL